MEEVMMVQVMTKYKKLKSETQISRSVRLLINVSNEKIPSK